MLKLLIFVLKYLLKSNPVNKKELKDSLTKFCNLDDSIRKLYVQWDGLYSNNQHGFESLNRRKAYHVGRPKIVKDASCMQKLEETIDELDVACSHFLEAHFNDIKDVDTLVISIGSALSGEKSQSYPNFARQMDKSNVRVLCFDPHFRKQLASSELPVVKIPLTLGQTDYPNCYLQVAAEIKRRLAAGKQVVFICHLTYFARA